MNILPATQRSVYTSCCVIPQNGVVDGQLLSSQQIAMGPPIASLHGGVGSGDAQKRPKNLAVASLNGYGPKSLRADGGGGDDDDEVEDGSLPCTPELDSGADESRCAAGDEALDSDTRQLVGQFFQDFTGLKKSQWNESKALSTMKRVVEGILEKHRYAYNGMINKLSLDERGDDVSFVCAVAKSLFADRTTNWGRIASLVAFGAVVCQHMKERGRTNCVELVAEDISTYLLCEQREWLVKNNAWDGFVEFFRVADPESTVRNTLMAFAGFAGIGATLALLIR